MKRKEVQKIYLMKLPLSSGVGSGASGVVIVASGVVIGASVVSSTLHEN